MNVLIVSTFAPPHVGGLEVVVEQQAKSLAEMGHDVTVFTSRHHRDLARDERVDGYRVVRTPVFNALDRRTSVPFPLWGARSLLPLMKLVRRADLVHIHDVYYQPTCLAATLARAMRRPLFATQHVSMVEHDSPVVMGAQRLIYATAGARLWKWCHGIVVYNTIVQGFLADRGVPEEKVHLTYNGVDVDVFRPGDAGIRGATRARYGLPQDKPLVLFVGRLVPKKGYRELMAAHHEDYEIVLAGPGAVPADVPSGVTFVGPVERCELLSLYQASDLFALPAVGEMLTLAMQEAMACGLPAVATADAAYSSYGLDHDAVALVRPEPDVLRKTFTGILRDDERRRRMCAYSRQLAVERFDWQSNAHGLTAMYGAVGPSVTRHHRGADRFEQPQMALAGAGEERC